MQVLIYLADFMVPAVILLIVTYGLSERVKVYDEFVKGAKKGISTVVKIMPTLVGLMVGVGVLRASGFLDFLSGLLGRVTDYIGFPSQIVPLTIVRMFSSSAATGLDWVNRIRHDVLYRNYFLHYERVFYGCKSEENPVYIDWGIACNSCRNCGECLVGKLYLI